MKILIAEDDLTSRSMLSAVLKKAGHDVVEAVNGIEALEELEKNDAPRLVLLDWVMPEMDGLVLLKRLRALKKASPSYVIMLTAKGEKSDIVTGLNAGADDYLSKPFDPGELRARVDVGRRMVEMQDTLNMQLHKLRKAVEHIKTLQGILPICSFCKKIRNDKGYWDQVETYVTNHSNAEFSHGICPDCMKKHYPDISDCDMDDEEIPGDMD
jgi:DNA-binding response OmpR family regulator